MKINNEQREKNIEKQKRYREKLKNSNSYRLTVTVEKETFNLIRDIALKSKISQGEVIDRILKGGGEMNIAAAETINTEMDVVKTTVDRFRYEDFELSELAIDVISSKLGLNSQEIFKEEVKDRPDHEKIKILREQRKQFLREQSMIYSGNRKIMKTCIEQYSPTILASFDEID